MWNLTGDDVQRAKEELKGRRAAIQARYDSELKHLESAIADIETFERAAVNFVANFKGEDGLSATVADPEPAAENTVAAVASEPPTSAEPTSAEAAPAAGPEPVAAEKSSSRWRMRLSAAEGSP